MKRLKRKDIDSRLEEFTENLSNNQRHIDGKVGWHQHLGSSKIGIVATAMALIYYDIMNLDCPDKDQCLNFIVGSVQQDGGWSYISNANGYSNVESTCWALLALHHYRKSEYEAIINNGVNWILSIIDNENKDNGWPFAPEGPSRVYITALTLRVLFELQLNDKPQFESAKHWLKMAVNDDGGWGDLPENGSSLFFTSYCITTLLDIGEEPNSPTLKRAFKWLTNRVRNLNKEAPSLECYLEFIENGSGTNRVRIPFFHYVMPHVIMAFIKMKSRDSSLFDCIYSLFFKSSNGLIEHPDLENSKIYPIWALYDSALAFKTLKDSYGEKWNKQYAFVKLCKHFFALRWYNPTTLITIIPNWIWGCMIIFVFTLLALKFGTPVISWVNSWGNSNVSQIIFSLIASILYGFIANGFSYLWRKKAYYPSKL